MRLPRLNLEGCDACTLCGLEWVDLDVVFAVGQKGEDRRALHAVCFLGVVKHAECSEPVVIVNGGARTEFEKDRIFAMQQELERAHRIFTSSSNKEIKRDQYPFLVVALEKQVERITKHLKAHEEAS